MDKLGVKLRRGRNSGGGYTVNECDIRDRWSHASTSSLSSSSLSFDYRQNFGRSINNEHVALDMSALPARHAKKNGPPRMIEYVNERNSLHRVAGDGDVTTMATMLDSFPSKKALTRAINELDKNSLAPLHLAAHYNRYDMVQLLVDNGAEVKITGLDGMSPLHMAARHIHSMTEKCYERDEVFCSDPNQVGILKRRLQSYPSNPIPACKTTKCDEKQRHKSMPLIFEEESPRRTRSTPAPQEHVQYDNADYSPPPSYHSSLTTNIDIDIDDQSVIQLLVSQGAELNGRDDHGLTPLSHAATRGSVQATTDLLKCNDIDIEARDNEGRTPLCLACIHGNEEIAMFLLEAGANARVRDDALSTPLLRAAADGNLGIVRVLLETAEQEGGHITLSEMLMDKDGHEVSALAFTIEKRRPDVVQHLVSKGADVNVACKKQEFPLHLAAAKGDEDIVRILVQNDAYIDCVNAEQETPLHRATIFNHVAVMHFLMELGANMEQRDVNRCTPLILAASYGHVEAIECLMQWGADPRVEDKIRRTVVFCAAERNQHDALIALLKGRLSKELLQKPNNQGNCPLHVAASRGFLAVTQTLVDSGCPVEVKNEDERTALHLGALHGKTRIVRALLSKKASYGSKDDEGNTALHLAASTGQDDILKALLEVGANVEIRNARAWRAIESASNNGHVNAVRILLDAGTQIITEEKAKTTALHLAAGSGNVDVVLLLLDFGANVSTADEHGQNCLEVAIQNNRREVARAIIRSKYWEDAMHSIKYTEDGLKVTPMRMLIRNMPDIAEEVLARCTCTNKVSPEHPLYTVNFDYTLLDDMLSDMNMAAGNENDKNGRGSQPTLKENHTLMLMVQCKQQQLLSHSVCVSLLHLKWTHFSRYVYYGNLMLYIVFIAFMSGYILSLPQPIVTTNPIYVVTEVPFLHAPDATETIYVSVCDMSQQNRDSLHIVQSLFIKACKHVIVIMASIHMVKELLELYTMRLSYFGFQNMLEWGCYVTSIVLVIDFSECSSETGVREVWQWQVGACAILLTWINLFLFISKFPFLGIYVVMFAHVCRTSFKVFVVFFFLVTAFAFGLHIALYNQPWEFTYPLKSILGTWAMLLGEFNFDDHFDDSALLFPIPAYALFVPVILFLSIVTYNMLTGLAVDDIGDVKAKANLKRLAMQVHLVLNVESMLPTVLRQRFALKRHSFQPNQRTETGGIFKGLFAWWNSAEQLKEAIRASETTINESGSEAFIQKKNEIEKIQETLEFLMHNTISLGERVVGIKNDYDRLRKMSLLLLRHEGLRWDEDDVDENANEDGQAA